MVLWNGGSGGNILSGIVLSTEWYPSAWQGLNPARKERTGQEYLTVLWQTGKTTIMPANYKGLEVISESR